jgi:methionyl-tRNA formyltransferase
VVQSRLKIVFAGTPAFAATTLKALLAASHDVIAVYTQPDRPAGRGLKLTQSPVKEFALSVSLPVYQPASLKDSEQQALLKDLNADVMVVAAYGLLLPPAVLTIPKFGCLNIHPSLLPRFRGAAPIQRTIFSGDTETGVTIMQMDHGLDTGPILLQMHYAMSAHETSASLHDKLADLGASALLQTLDLLAQNKLTPIIQDNALATYASKIIKEEALIDWQRPSAELDCEIRAFNPWPVAYTTWKGEHIRIWQAQLLTDNHNAQPRTILHASHEGIDIAAGVGALRLLQVQLPGGKKLSAADFYNSKHAELIIGEKFI